MNPLLLILIILIIVFLVWIIWVRPQNSNNPTNVSFSSALGPDEEVPPAISEGEGVMNVGNLSADRNTFTYEIHVRNLTGTPTAAHFHRGPRGQNGPIVKGLRIQRDENGDFMSGGVWSVTDTTQPLTADLVEDLLSGNIYINYHTRRYPDGEIRGQVEREL